MLGPPQISWRGGAFSLARRQARALLYYLANASAAVSRDKLLFFFWSDEPEAKARRNLIRLVSYLRQELPQPEILLVERESLQINPERAWVDAERFSRLCAEDATHEQAVPLYKGPFLMGFSLASSPEFDFWLTEQQGRYEGLYLKTLAELVRTKGEEGEIVAAIQYAQQYLSVDALAEEIHRSLIALYAAQGNRTAALKQYETCVQVLERELGVSPLPETSAVYESAWKGRPAPTSPAIKQTWTVLPSLHLPLVGRESAWEALEAAYRQLHSGGVILISGEAGVGKSRLMQEFATRSKRTVLTGLNHPSTQTLPYHTLVQALRKALPHSHLWSGIAPIWLGEITQLLPELRDHFPDLPQPLAVEPGQAQARLFEALTQVFLGLAAQSALLLCLDDLHWADEATRGWLSAVSPRLAGSQVCILGTYRQEERESLHEILRACHRASLLAEVVLGGLSLQAIGEILEQVSADGPRRAQLATRLHQATGGNPFFVLEIIRALLEGEQLDVPPEVLPIPKTVRETIHTRLARLTPLARQILDAAAVLSPDLAMALLWQTAGRTELEAADGLDELAQRRLVHEQAGVLAFHHELLCTTVYQSLTPWRRELLHRRAGDALRDMYARNPETVAAQTAYHYDAGGLYEQAVESYEMAATAAREVYANQEAIRHLHRAIALASASEHEDRLLARLHQSLAESLAFIGRYPEAFEAYQSALKGIPGSEPVKRADLLRKQAKTLVPQQKYSEAVELYKKTIDDLQACRNIDSETWMQVWLDTHLGLMDALYFQALPEEMSQVSRDIQGMLDQFGTPEQRFQILNFLDAMELQQSRYQPNEINLENRRILLDHEMRTGDPVKIAGAHFGYAFVLLWHGDLSLARQHFTEALSVAEKAAYGLLQVQCSIYLMVLHRLQGETSLVEEMWLSTHQVAKEVGFPVYIGSSLANRAWLNYRQSQWEAATADARAALECWGNSPYPFKWLAYWVVLAIALRQDRFGDAVEAARAMLGPPQQRQPDDLSAVLEEALRSWEKQDIERAQGFLEQAVRLAQERGFL